MAGAGERPRVATGLAVVAVCYSGTRGATAAIRAYMDGQDSSALFGTVAARIRFGRPNVVTHSVLFDLFCWAIKGPYGCAFWASSRAHLSERP